MSFKMKHFEKFVRNKRHTNSDVEELFLILINSNSSKTSRALEIVHKYRKEFFERMFKEALFKGDDQNEFALDRFRRFVSHKGTYPDRIFLLILNFILKEIKDKSARNELLETVRLSRPKLIEEIKTKE